MTELPQGWAEATVGEVAEVRLGRQRSPKRATGDRMRPYLRAANVTWQGLALGDVKEMDFTASESVTYELRAGDLLLAEASGSASEVGKPAQYRGEIAECCFQNTLIRVRLPGGLSPDYFERFFREQAMNGKFAAGSRGVGIHHLGAASLSEWTAPIPPRTEQDRIVAAIEETFSKLDAAEAGLRTVRILLKRMRAAVLTAAVTGQLVPQDPTDASASELLADLDIEPAATQYDVPASWEWVKLGDVLREPLRNGMSAPPSDPSNGLPTFSITAVTTGDFSETNIKFTAGDWSKADALWAEPGDLFVQRSNTPELVGTARLYRGVPKTAVFPDLLIRVRTVEQVLPDWLEAFMAAPRSRTHIRGQAKGLAGSMPKIAQPVLQRLAIPIPPCEEQARIVAEVKRQFSFIEACERAIDAGLARSAALRRSVLKAAFEGRLVPQDPTDEPASVILDRIRAERAATRKPRRARQS